MNATICRHSLCDVLECVLVFLTQGTVEHGSDAAFGSIEDLDNRLKMTARDPCHQNRRFIDGHVILEGVKRRFGPNIALHLFS